MKNGTATQVDLRLVGQETSPWGDANDHAGYCPQMLQPYDPRWVFAVRAATELNRSSSPLLITESRERIIGQAMGMGLSRFDAMAIISIVAGEAAAGRDPLGSGIESRLATIGHNPNQRSQQSKTCGISMAFAAVTTALIMGGFIYAMMNL